MDISVQKQIANGGITRQRNFFAGCLALTIAANFFLSLKLAATSEKLVMVPGITREMVLSGSNVSASYLEESALLYMSALLDLTPSTIEAKREMILRYASKRNSRSLKSLQEYFANAIEEHRKFKLFTSFSPKKLHVDTKEMQVIVEGILTTNFGKRAHDEKNVKYKMSFEFEAGRLLLQEFVELKPKKLIKKSE